MRMGFFGLIIMTVLSSCGWFEGERQNLNERVFEDHKTAERSFNDSQIVCDLEQGDCPDYVGGLLSLSADRLEIKACSLTLVSRNTVLTNSHCLPDDLKSEGAFCVGRINIIFPQANGKPMEKRDCSYIKKLSDQEFSNQVAYPDWVLLRLGQPVDRIPAKKSVRSIARGMNIDLYKVDFDLDAETSSLGRVRRAQCLANTNFFLSLHNLGSRSPLIDISHCDRNLISGNSGSGYFDEEGSLVGVHSFGVSVEKSNDSWAQFFRDKYPNIRQNFGGGVHLSCISNLNHHQVAPHCDFPGPSYAGLSELYGKSMQQRLWRSSFNKIGEKDILANSSKKVRWSEDDQAKRRVLFFNDNEAIPFAFNRVFQAYVENQFPKLPICVKAEQYSFEIPFAYRDRQDVLPRTEVRTLERLLASRRVDETLKLSWDEKDQKFVSDFTEYLPEEDRLLLGDYLDEGLFLQIPFCD